MQVADLEGRRVLVTGAGGFIGSHLTQLLVDTGAKISALVRYNSRTDWGHLQRLPPDDLAGIEVISGDLRDPFFVDRILRGKEVVFHLGALIPIPYSYVAPSEYVDTNVRGSLNVFEAARQQGVERVVHTSTSEVYGSAIYTPIDEAHPLQGQSPYSATKIGADKLAEAYWRSFGTPIVTVRPFNTYGPRQSARAFLPTVLSQALSRDVVRVGALDPVRDMNYVEDTVRGFALAAAASGVEGLCFNLGSGVGVSMRSLLETAFEAIDRFPEVEQESARARPEASEVLELVCDSGRAQEQLGWRSEVPLNEGVKRTAEWLAENLAEYKPDLYTV